VFSTTWIYAISTAIAICPVAAVTLLLCEHENCALLSYNLQTVINLQMVNLVKFSPSCLLIDIVMVVNGALNVQSICYSS